MSHLTPHHEQIPQYETPDDLSAQARDALAAGAISSALDTFYEEHEMQSSREARTAFKDLVSYIEQRAAEQGEPYELLSKLPNGFLSGRRKAFMRPEDGPFQPNAFVYRSDVLGTGDVLHNTWTQIATLEQAQRSDDLGSIEIQLEKGESHPSDVYLLGTNGTVERFRRTSDNDGIDDLGEKIGWHERVYSLGLLDAEQTKDLLAVISGEKPLIVEDDAELNIQHEVTAEDIDGHDDPNVDFDDQEYDDTDSDREAGGGTTSQERYAAAVEQDEEDEDPLEGDVDRWVHPDETQNTSDWGNHARAARQHGDLTD